MDNPMIKIVNAATGEEIEREMTAEEFAQHQVDQAAYAFRLAEAEAKAEAKAALLTRLGITAEEAALLLGGN
jgi:hypothetical protein